MTASKTRPARRRWLASLLMAGCMAVQAPGFAQAQHALPPIEMPAPANSYDIQHGVRIPMRDGVRLSADLYVPVGVPGPYPAILLRTPYSKDERFSKWVGDLFAAHGYVVVAEDKRGRFESEGEYTISDHEIADSYDTIDWIAHQGWSSAKVGAYGCSDRGDAVIYAAASRHPALKAVIAEAAAGAMGRAGGGYGYFSGRNGGAVELVMGMEWMADNGVKSFLAPPKNLSWEEFQKLRANYKLDYTPPPIDYDKAVWHLPTIDLLKAQGVPPTDWEHLDGLELTDPFWDQRDFLKGEEKISVPAMHVNSWYDFGPGVTLQERALFERNADNATARDNQFAVISPTLHCRSVFATADYKVGDRPMGDPRFGQPALFLKWFDHWLKGEDNHVTDMPKVQYYLMGKNAWRSAAGWPAPGSKPLTLYLAGGAGAANGPSAQGLLTTGKPKDGKAVDRFSYDPAHPVPSIGGSLCCINSAKLEGAFDQREVEARADVLTYSTEPFKQGLAVVGPIEAVLYVSSSARDTDFTVKLVDVGPDGVAFNINEAILRARYREGFDRPTLMTPGKVYPLRIRLQDTANYFAPGHRLRIEVSSSNFPRFDRNLNTGGHNYDETQWVTADNQVHRNAKAASHLVLTVLSEP